VANFMVLNSFITASDRAYSEEWFDTCPLLSWLFRLLLADPSSISASPSRQEVSVCLPLLLNSVCEVA
jgi:hypothetical protein